MRFDIEVIFYERKSFNNNFFTERYAIYSLIGQQNLCNQFL